MILWTCRVIRGPGIRVFMKPELLLPVGNMSMCLAAIHHGADAVYVGMPGFNARGRTQDFSLHELKELIDTCHLYGVRVHLAFNVLIFESELEDAADILEQVIPLGPDAFIVQDLGLARLIRKMAPNQRIHGSTQMTVTNHEAIDLVSDLDIQRFVLGRENSLPEIKMIRGNTTKELEVFVHGALCVAYSGQCFTSESLGGRSANRGQCAQSCRLGYELFVDGEKRELGDKQYLVSPQDLCGIEEVPALIQAGVHSFKVEGRLKTQEYVATTAKNYQEVINGADAQDQSRKREMATAYGRGFFSGWLHGVDHQRLVEGSFSSHRGFEIGTVEKIYKDKISLRTHEELISGQGLVFEGLSTELGGKVHSAVRKGEFIDVFFVTNLNYSQIKPHSRVWINSDDRLKKATHKKMAERESMKRIPLSVDVSLRTGFPVTLNVTDPEFRTCKVIGENVTPAIKASTTLLNVKEELSSLGTTAFKLDKIKFDSDGGYLSQKDLKQLRRSMVEAITNARLNRKSQIELVPTQALAELKFASIETNEKKILNIVLRERAQIDDLILRRDRFDITSLGIIFLDYEFGKDYAESVSLLREAGFKVGIATTRILKPKEYYNFKIIERALPDAILIRNLGALQYFKEKKFRLIGDFSLNVSNSLTARYLLDKGLESVCASYDLNQTQLEGLTSNCSSVEVTLHQYMPEFHMEHCVFAAFMSKGSSFKDCGKPCEKHKVEMKDAYGNMHFLKADQECRNTMFRGTPQSASFLVSKMPEVKTWRFEALYERGDTLFNKINAYLNLLNSKETSHGITQLLGSTEKYGVTEGQLSNTGKWRDRKKEAIGDQV